MQYQTRDGDSQSYRLQIQKILFLNCDLLQAITNIEKEIFFVVSQESLTDTYFLWLLYFKNLFCGIEQRTQLKNKPAFFRLSLIWFQPMRCKQNFGIKFEESSSKGENYVFLRLPCCSCLEHRCDGWSCCTYIVSMQKKKKTNSVSMSQALNQYQPPPFLNISFYENNKPTRCTSSLFEFSTASPKCKSLSDKHWQ